MVYVTITLDRDGCITCLKSAGHSDVKTKNGNLVCAAITILIRTASRLLYCEPEININGGAQKAGSLYFEILSKPVSRIDWIKGISDYLLLGINDLKSEYPKEISIEIIKQ